VSVDPAWDEFGRWHHPAQNCMLHVAINEIGFTIGPLLILHVE